VGPRRAFRNRGAESDGDDDDDDSTKTRKAREQNEAAFPAARKGKKDAAAVALT
jgi:hypothetical protein